MDGLAHAHDAPIGGSFDVAHAPSAAARQVAPGFTVRDLWRRGARHAQLVEIAPGGVYPGRDLHEPGPEIVFVVSGVFEDGRSAHPAGTFIHADRGSWHRPGSTLGCTLFLFYPDG